MTTQEIAPAQAALEDAPPAADVEEPAEHPIVTHLRKCLATSIEIADDYAGRGGKEREIAAWHLAQADRYDDEAMAKRGDVAMWRVLLERAIAEATREQQPEVAAEPETPRAGNPYVWMAACPVCDVTVRPLTAQEQADVQAGHPMPDVRGECPNCLINVAPEQS